MVTMKEMAHKALERMSVVAKVSRLFEFCPHWFSPEGVRALLALQRFHQIPEEARLALATEIGVGLPIGKHIDLIIEKSDIQIWRTTIDAFSQVLPPAKQGTGPTSAAPAPAPSEVPRNLNEPVPGANDQRQETLFNEKDLNPGPPAPASAPPPVAVDAAPAPKPAAAPAPKRVLSEDELLANLQNQKREDELRLQTILAAYNPSRLEEAAGEMAIKFGMKRYEVCKIWVDYGKRKRMIIDEAEVIEFFEDHPEFKGKIQETAKILGYSSTAVGAIHFRKYGPIRKMNAAAENDPKTVQASEPE